MDKRYGIKFQILIGILTIGLFVMDDITVGEAIIITLLGGMYNRLIRLDLSRDTNEKRSE